MPDVRPPSRRRSLWTYGVGLFGLLPLLALGKSRDDADAGWSGDVGPFGGLGSSGPNPHGAWHDASLGTRVQTGRWHDAAGTVPAPVLRAPAWSRSSNSDAVPSVLPATWSGPAPAEAFHRVGSDFMPPPLSGAGETGTGLWFIPLPGSTGGGAGGGSVAGAPRPGGIWFIPSQPGSSTGSGAAGGTGSSGGTQGPGDAGGTGGSDGAGSTGGSHGGGTPPPDPDSHHGGQPPGQGAGSGSNDPPSIPIDGGVPQYPIDPIDPGQVIAGGMAPVPDAAGLWIALSGLAVLGAWQRWIRGNDRRSAGRGKGPGSRTGFRPVR